MTCNIWKRKETVYIDMMMARQLVVVGCQLERERRTDVGKREGMVEDMEGKETLTFLESHRVVRQPRLHQHL